MILALVTLSKALALFSYIDFHDFLPCLKLFLLSFEYRKTYRYEFMSFGYTLLFYL